MGNDLLYAKIEAPINLLLQKDSDFTLYALLRYEALCRIKPLFFRFRGHTTYCWTGGARKAIYCIRT